MSVARPILGYVKNIRTQADIPHTISTFKRLLKYHQRYVGFFAIIVILAAVKSYLFALEPLFTAEIIDQVITQGKYNLLEPLVTDLVLAVGGYALLNYVATYSQAYVAQLIERHIRSNYYMSLQAKPFKFYDSAQVGDLVSRATLDLQQLEQFLNSWTGTIATSIFSSIIMLSIMLCPQTLPTTLGWHNRSIHAQTGGTVR